MNSVFVHSADFHVTQILAKPCGTESNLPSLANFNEFGEWIEFCKLTELNERNKLTELAEFCKLTELNERSQPNKRNKPIDRVRDPYHLIE
jgi:hypothetical protein